MAEKPKSTAAAKQPVAPKSSGLAVKAVAAAVAVCLLIGLGFAAGVYLQIIDIGQMAQDLNLTKYPVIASLVPKTNFEPVEITDDNKSTEHEASPSAQARAVPPVGQTPQSAKPDIITQEDLTKQTKLKEQEDAKRISRLARLYGGMKPAEAVAIMQQLEDPVILAIFAKMEEEQVAKVMALLDAKRAARLTEDMFKGQVRPPTL